MKFLIVGLGNIGNEYAHTRHNIGFDVVDALVRKHNGSFMTERHADYAQVNVKGKQLHVIKPTTYMNLSGKAVRYWMQQLKIDIPQLMVVVDELAIDFGKVRIRTGGSDAGHNGLKNIQELLGTQQYPRLRFGIGNNFPKGRQVEYVLGHFTADEQSKLPALVDHCVEALEAFASIGLERTMNFYNK